MNLEEVSKGRDNNLDLIRFIAACMVIFSHAFPLSLGKEVSDPLGTLTNGQINFGSMAVSIFFLYGGFLICKSIHRTKNAKEYFKARMIRIFPPLIFVTIVLVVLVGPFLTTLTISKYFSNVETYRYLLNSILILQHNLPEVFANNIYGQAVNGPLWTLPIEFLCYIMCFLAYQCKLLNRKNTIFASIIFVLGCIMIKIISGNIPILASMIQPMGLFFVGMLYYVYQENIIMKIQLCFISLIGIVVSLIFGIFPITIYVFLSYFLMYIGFGTRIKFPNFAKYGEVSYGMYLCAWPIQQILVQYLGNAGKMNPWFNFLLATPIAIIFGYIIYKIIEKPLGNYTLKIKLKKKEE